MNKKENKRDNILSRRMRDLGYDDVTEWKRNSKVLLSFETCRRAIYGWSQSIRHDYIVRLMLVLDFTLPEIREELLRRGDKYLHRLITESGKGVLLNDQEKLIIDKLRKQTDLVPFVTTLVTLRDSKK